MYHIKLLIFEIYCFGSERLYLKLVSGMYLIIRITYFPPAYDFFFKL